MGWLQLMLLAVLGALLVRAAWGDIRSRTIPNRLNGAVALLAPAWWYAAGLAPWPGMALQIALALVMLLLFAGLFALGMMGGGDVKLIAALALWLPAGPLLRMLVAMALAGGVLTLAMLVHHRARRRGGQPEIPYGVAISAAALWVCANDILTIPVHS